MPITYDITKDSFYLEGLKKVEEKTKRIIKNLLIKGHDIKYIAEVAEVTQKYVKQVQKEVQEKT